MKKIFILSTLSILLFGAIAWGVATFLHARLLPIKTIIVKSDYSTTDKASVEQLIKPFTRAGLFSVNLHAIQSQLQTLPWVARVNVQRVWPNELVVDLLPEHPVVRWNQNSLLNPYGEVFIKGVSSEDFKNLPEFIGPNGSSVLMLGYFQQINALLMSINLKAIKMQLNENGAWSIGLNNGINLTLDKDRLLGQLNRFMEVYKKRLAAKADHIMSIDLRYDDGLAVRWKQ